MKVWSAAALILLAACAPASGPGGEGSDSFSAPPPEGPLPVQPPAPAAQAPGAAPQDSANLARLEREARQIARTGPCDAEGSCRTAPVGSRPCGGPRTYIVYCATTTDTVALNRKLEELRLAEERYNQQTGAVSTCEFRLPPETRLTGSTCREAPAP